MKRLYVGVALLVAVLGLGVLSMLLFGRFSRCLEKDLKRAEQAAEAEEWAQAEEYAKKAWKEWNSWRKYAAAVSEETPLEGMNVLFDRLELYGKRRNTLEFCQTCRELALLSQAVGQSQGLDFWSVL